MYLIVRDEHRKYVSKTNLIVRDEHRKYVSKTNLLKEEQKNIWQLSSVKRTKDTNY